MGILTVKEIADMMDGEIIDGDPCITISDYSYNSKEGDSQTLFLPIVGENRDAHDFIPDALSNGMIATVTERGRVEENTEGMTYIAVDSTRDAIQRLGMRYRMCFSPKCVGITGSVGKTTTKEMIAAALEGSKKVIKTEGNKNGQLGLPLMALKTDENTEVLVLEMGVSIIGEMERLAKIARPDIAVVTNIGFSHVGNFGSQQNIRREKLGIINEMDENGILLLNGENELLSELAPGSPTQKDISELGLYEETTEVMGNIRRLSYGLSKWCDFRAEDVVSDATGSSFTFRYKDMEIPVRLKVCGSHNILNAVSALACAVLLDADMDAALKMLGDYEPLAMRGKIEKTENGTWLIDDSYNASPDSMKSGLWLLSNAVNEGRKIAMLADMLELGDYSEELHRLVGKYAAESKADIIICVGKEAEFIADEAEKLSDKEIKSFETREEAEKYLLETLKPGDCVLCKGSRGMQLDKTAKLIREAGGEKA
ncbi:MAG: UDP-N-acetylmuramoyl-tripeptide--D-alanyl-D-alanine ligase [Lachnospiraceae bacterium]|nr:UDP-N-acetylmuramoyl-tripeptide--D-alanyl-D-alanine ligase [Lachnospiraceae bacterium]MBR6274891.1 UDP-N-acetylmuramoyl-tripeptide--D-alanyl-D-alanine ligase [Lachnospiraceae bacterium]